MRSTYDGSCHSSIQPHQADMAHQPIPLYSDLLYPRYDPGRVSIVTDVLGAVGTGGRSNRRWFL